MAGRRAYSPQEEGRGYFRAPSDRVGWGRFGPSCDASIGSPWLLFYTQDGKDGIWGGQFPPPPSIQDEFVVSVYTATVFTNRSRGYRWEMVQGGVNGGWMVAWDIDNQDFW